MRLSIVHGDPGEVPYARLMNANKKVDIFLNGVLQSKVRTADDETGEILRFKTDEAGDYVIDEQHKCLVQELLLGKVTFEITEAP